ncbi:MAG TPA: hybrid sensor histidine kinase/response regulator [Sedimenticola thiotaurini]|uniref:histidine kinase n=1 Tax=Sedimenticola thiotaurini TaxID=1543721 RepID=A0A831W8S1_9GAMM|nr:hybrid sensor histidine kinase/response regulator [Sedimenticola thiotaurini]
MINWPGSDRAGQPAAERPVRSLSGSPEFKSAIIRMGMWLFASLYFGVASYAGYYQGDSRGIFWLFGIYLGTSLGFLFSVIRRPYWPARIYLGLLTDISAVSAAIYLTGQAFSPFFLLYIWIFVGYGARYGRNYLNVASVVSIVSYSVVLLLTGGWAAAPLEAAFYLLVLFALPLYQRQLLGRLYHAQLEAERSAQARELFLSTMTQELRGPLGGIRGIARKLQETPLTRQQEEYVETIASSAVLLNALIGDVLDFSRIGSSDLRLEWTPFELRTAVRDVCEALSNRALDKGLELICHIDARLPRVGVGDELRLKQILFNLVGNAIKFTDRGHVEVVVRPLERRDRHGQGWLRIEVRDTGIGIAAEQRSRVFERFWQADPAAGGTGLGTTVARSLVHLMEGRIGFDSRPGEGSCFWLELPLLAAEFSERIQLNDDRPLRALAFEVDERSLRTLRDACTELRILCRPVARIADLSGVVAAIGEAEEGIDLAMISDTPEGVDIRRLADVIREHLGTSLPVLFIGYRGRHLIPDTPHTGFLVKPVTVEPLWQAVSALLAKEPDER